MRKKIIIASKFNIMTGERNATYNKNTHLKSDRNWILNRMHIFMTSTFKSLVNQTNQDFTAVYVYDDSTELLIREALNNYPPLPYNIVFVRKSEYNNLIHNLSCGYDLLYYVRLDSDDMYCKDYVDRLINYPIKDDTEVLLSQYGYIYDSPNNNLAEYYHYQFTFYTFIYRLNRETTEYSSLNVTPWDLLVNFSHGACVLYRYEVLPGRNFIFHIHGGNTDSTFGIYNWGFAVVERLITEPNEKQVILNNFY